MNSKILISVGAIAGISIAAVMAITFVATLGDDSDVSLSPEEINKLEQSENIPRQFIEITNDNPEFFEKWCRDQNGNWEIKQSQIGGFCYFDSRTEKIKAELEWDRLQHPVIIGDDAQKICHVLDLKCNQDAEFEGWFDDETGYVKLDYSLHDKEYSFRIQGDSIEYSRPDVSSFWYSYDEAFDQRLNFELSDNFYFAGNEIQISGNVFEHPVNDVGDMPVILQVYFGNDVVEIAQIPVSSNDRFSHQIKTEGPQWQQSGRYTAVVSFDSGKMEKDFGFSTYYVGKPTKYFTDLDSGDYEELCGYPVTHKMQQEFLESWKARHDDKDPFLTIRQGTFSHVERSQYLTAMPILHYWYDLKNGQQIYFGMEACSLDRMLFRAEPGPNWEPPKEFEIDGITYVELEAPGRPLIYKDTLLPVLDTDNCKRVADEYTKQQSQKIYLRENTFSERDWENQVFPLMDYCTDIGEYESNTRDGNISWNFILK